MGLLDDIIEGATSESVTTSNLLRRVQVVAHRLDAHEIKAWVQQELNGYNSIEALPKYRADLIVNVLGVWSGPMQTRMTQPLSSGRIPDDARDVLFRVNFTQPLAELEQLAGSEKDAEMGTPWDPLHVTRYNKWAAEGLVPYMEFMSLLSANRIVTPAMLHGVIDSVRNTALDFALVLQTANPDAGSVNGPTVSDAPVAQAVWHVTNNIYGDGAQLAHGENIRQQSKVVKGDLAGLLRAAEEAGLDAEGRDELARTVLSDEARRPSRVKTFLSKVGDGAFAIGTGMTADVAATQLSELISSYLG